MIMVLPKIEIMCLVFHAWCLVIAIALDFGQIIRSSELLFCGLAGLVPK
jgi:hypothetical protein